MEEKAKKSLVCEVSGNVVQNTEIRIQEHYQGRLYLGWKKVRDRYALIKDKYKDKRHPNPQWRHRTKTVKRKPLARSGGRRSYSRRDGGFDRAPRRRAADDYRRDEGATAAELARRPLRDDDRRRRRSRSRSRGRSRVPMMTTRGRGTTSRSRSHRWSVFYPGTHMHAVPARASDTEVLLLAAKLRFRMPVAR